MHDQLRDDWTIRETDWGSIQPAIHRSGGSTYELPQPVRTVCVMDIGSGGQVGTPLSGDGTKPAGVAVVVKGEMVVPDGSSTPYVDAMFDAIQELRDELDCENATSFDFYLHHDATNAVYRRLQSCTVKQFDWELVSDDVVEYAFVIHTTTLSIDETAPT